jgi:hypothetical protein
LARVATVVVAVVLVMWLVFPVTPIARPILDALGFPTPTPYVIETCTPPAGYTVCGSEFQRLYPDGP